MATGTGRGEKRVDLRMPVQIFKVQGHGFTDTTEKTTTENVSSRGARVLTRQTLQPQEQLSVTLLGGQVPTLARVIYSQPLAGKLFGVGLQFEEEQAAAA